jgi:hypothetical protein
VMGRLALQIDVEGAGLSPRALIGSLSGNGLVSISQAQFAALNAKVFETATRAVDQEAALDMKKISEAAGSALENGTLSVPSAEGVVTVAQGQIRLTNLVTHAEGADLMVNGSVDLTEQNLNARLALSASKDASPPAGEQPGVSVFLSGPIANPKRTVDASALTAWLMLRAVEQQSKQLEAMEARRRAAVTGQPAEDPRPVPVAPQPAPPAAQAPAAQAEAAPPLPPAIEVPSPPSILEQKPARGPAKTQRAIAAQPRSTPPKPLPLLPASPYD